MQLVSLKIHNILSISDIEYNFAGSNGLVLLKGWNHDDNTANGAGKSSIINAVSFCLYGKAPRKITVSDFLRKGQKSGYSEVTLKTGDDVWTVCRSRPSAVVYVKNGQDQKISQDEFEASIRLSYDQFLITMYSAQTESKKLISLNDSAKKDFFLKLMDLQRFTDCKKAADVELKALQDAEAQLILLHDQLTYKINYISENYIDITEIQLQIQKTKSLIEELEQTKITYYTEQPDMSTYNSMSAKIENKRRQVQNEKAQQLDIKRQIDYHQMIIDNDNQRHACPSCSHVFFADQSAKDISSGWLLENKIEYVDHDARLLKIEQLRIKNQTEKDAAYSKYISDSRIHNQAVNDLANCKNTLSMLNSNLHKAEKDADELLNLKAKIEKVNNKIQKITQEKTVLEIVSQVYSSTGAQAYIMDSIIESFNNTVNEYVSLVWPAANYSLMTYKENKKGDIKAKFAEKLVINGEERSIGSLSGGEFRCLSLALDFSIIDVVTNMFGVSLNPVFLDEPFNGLDVTNRDKVSELLEKVSSSRQVWVVDHISESQATFDTVVTVSKKNGQSTLMV